MVLSREAVRKIVDAGYNCPSPDYPDDMYLGTVARELKIVIVHSPLFHQVISSCDYDPHVGQVCVGLSVFCTPISPLWLQSQPESFHPSVLKLQTAISFHRHSPQDPYTVYQKYLMEEGGREEVVDRESSLKDFAALSGKSGDVWRQKTEL